MSTVDLYDDCWRYFPGGHLRDRAEAIADAIDTGEHEDSPTDPQPESREPFSPSGDWSMTAAVQVTCLRSGYRFAGLVQQAGFGRWGVMGLATPETCSSTPNGEDRAHEILDAHSHQLLGVHHDFGYALAIAERFALHSPAPSELCNCTDVVMATQVAMTPAATPAKALAP